MPSVLVTRFTYKTFRPLCPSFLSCPYLLVEIFDSRAVKFTPCGAQSCGFWQMHGVRCPPPQFYAEHSVTLQIPTCFLSIQNPSPTPSTSGSHRAFLPVGLPMEPNDMECFGMVSSVLANVVAKYICDSSVLSGEPGVHSGTLRSRVRQYRCTTFTYPFTSGKTSGLFPVLDDYNFRL